MTTTAKRLHLLFGGSSIAGSKEQNEDALSALLPSESSVRKLKGAVACVSDGASCSDNAQLASQTCVTNFISDYYSTPDSWTVSDSSCRVMSSLNTWLHHYGQQTLATHNSFVATFSCVVFKSHTAYIFHVGDSRVYLLRGQELEQLTRDHYRQQNDGTGYLTKAMGVEPSLDVDYRQEPLELGDKFILTTDGVHGVLSDKELKQLLLTKGENDDDLSPSRALEARAACITQAALDKGSDDNVSCLIVDVCELPIERLEEAHRKLTQLKIPPVMQIGMKIDHFEILDVLHHGVRSDVYSVKSLEDQQQYVLKAPSENFSEDIPYLEGFVREQWVGRRIDSTQIMNIFPHPKSSPFLYHVCEYVEGQTLRQWMIDNPKPSLERVRAIVKSLVSAVRVLHRANMVHRDLKPENIFIQPGETVKLIDFGTVQVAGLDEIVSPIKEDTPVGDVGYIAPEYLLGRTLGATGTKGSIHSDLFSLGCIVYEMLAGKLPYKVPDNFNFSFNRVVNTYSDWSYLPLSLHRSDLPHWLDNVLRKATMPNPESRYAALSELYSDLESPDEEMRRKATDLPLIERNPLKFWKGFSLLLFIIACIELVWILRR